MATSPAPNAPRSPPAARAPDPGDERELLDRLRRGDAAAFERLVRDYSGPMLGAARRILRREDEARDALQDAFLSVFRGIGGFAGEAKLSTWLHRIAVNAALMKLRARKSVHETPIDDLLPTFDDTGHQVEPSAPWSERADVLAERAETRALVRRLIDELPETHRVVLTLRDIEEIPTEEVARLLDVTPNAVKIRVHRARQALRARLDATLHVPAGP